MIPLITINLIFNFISVSIFRTKLFRDKNFLFELKVKENLMLCTIIRDQGEAFPFQGQSKRKFKVVYDKRLGLNNRGWKPNGNFYYYTNNFVLKYRIADLLSRIGLN